MSCTCGCGRNLGESTGPNSDSSPKFSDVSVELIGQDGNVFSIIGKVTQALRRAGHMDAATEYQKAAMNCESYDEVLQLTMKTINIE